jgi:SAM-dependent methyltransferase
MPRAPEHAEAAARERIDVATHTPRTKEECEHYARYLWAASIVSGDVLDVACGTGYGTRLLAKRSRVTGVDRDERALELARSRATGRFINARVPPIPLADASFDFVVCFETVEHIADDLAFVREVARVLRAEGQLLLSTPNADVSAPDGSSRNQWHVREYTLTSLLALLDEAGLETVEVYAQSFPPRIPRAHRFLWRLHSLTWRQPAIIRRAAAPILGDATVREGEDHRRSPGYWLVRARHR